MPLSTVSKMGSRITLSRGSETRTSRPPRRSEAWACSSTAGSAARTTATSMPPMACSASTGSVSRALTTATAPRSRGKLQLLGRDVDGDGVAAEDPGVLQGEVTETADAEDRGPLGRAQARHLDGLVGGDAGAGQRRRVDGVDARGDELGEGSLCDEVLGEPAVAAVPRVDLPLAQALP